MSVEKIQLPGGLLPSKETLMHYRLAQIFQQNIEMGQTYFTGFELNANQKRVRQVIDTSQVPEGEWIHILLYGEPRSGKTWCALAYIMEMFLRFPGTRSLSIRNTTSELNTSVFLDLDQFAEKWNIPIIKRSTQEGLIELGNHSQFWFKSDKSLTPGARDNAARKMGGMAYSLAMVEEADTVSSETSRVIPTRLSQQSGNFRKVIFYTQNPPDKDHWTYEFFFKNPLGDPDDPASPIRAVHCPLDGNIEHIGVAYQNAMRREYQDDPAMEARFVKGIHAPAVKGDPIFKQSFNRNFHVAKDSFWQNWNRGLPILRGWDFGFRGNACVLAQDDVDRRQLRIFMVMFERKILFEHFIDLVLAACYRQFAGAEWIDYPDPNGDQHTALNAMSYHDIMRSRGLVPLIDKSRKAVIRGVNAISRELRLTGKAGQPAFLIDPTALQIIDAFTSGYCNNKGCLIDELRPVADNTYIHIMDALRYIVVMSRDTPRGPEEDSVQPFRVIEESERVRRQQNMEIHQYLGPTRGGFRDGGFSRSRFR